MCATHWANLIWRMMKEKHPDDNLANAWENVDESNIS